MSLLYNRAFCAAGFLPTAANGFRRRQLTAWSNTKKARRGTFRRRIVIAAGMAALVGSLPAGAVTLYKATPLGTINGKSNWATAINPGGDVAGVFGTLSQQSDWHAYLFSGSTMKDLGTLGSIYSYANAINSTQQVTGSSLTSSNAEHAFLYTGGKMQDLGTLGGGYSTGSGINSAGQMTGGSTKPGDQTMRAFVYSGGKMTDIGALSGTYGQHSFGTAINNSTQVTGYSYSFINSTDIIAHAFLFQSNTLVDLGTLGGTTSLGLGINYAGVVTGNADLRGDAAYHAFLYKASHMEDLGTLGGSFSSGNSVNAAEDVVGNSDTADGSNHPFVHVGDVMYDLNSLVVSGLSGAMLTGDGAPAINDNGQIAVTGCASACTGAQAVLRSYRLEPVSNPDPDLVLVLEYYNATLKHYFITWRPDEIAILDAGTTIKGWKRTGFMFTAYSQARAGTSPVCRYYIPPDLGDSHFFGRGTVECDATGQKNPSFTLEDANFMHIFLPTNGFCPANTTPVYRAFNNRADANHRYMTSVFQRDQMGAAGWILEGDGNDRVVMCAPGP